MCDVSLPTTLFPLCRSAFSPLPVAEKALDCVAVSRFRVVKRREGLRFGSQPCRCAARVFWRVGVRSWVWAEPVGASRLLARVLAAVGSEMRAPSVVISGSMKCVGDSGAGRALRWGGRSGSWREERFLAWDSPLLGDSWRETAWSCVFGALRLIGLVRCGTPRGPTARESSELIAHGESSELNPYFVGVCGGLGEPEGCAIALRKKSLHLFLKIDIVFDAPLRANRVRVRVRVRVWVLLGRSCAGIERRSTRVVVDAEAALQEAAALQVCKL